MSKKIQIIPIAIVGVLALGGGFFGGMQYGGGSGPERGIRGGDIAANLTRPFGSGGDHDDWRGGGQHQSDGDHLGGPSGSSRIRGGGGLLGEVIAIEDGALTLKTQDGGSKIVFFAADTQVREIISGNIDDALTGEQVLVFGQENPDGSYSAQSIQFGLPGWTQ